MVVEQCISAMHLVLKLLKLDMSKPKSNKNSNSNIDKVVLSSNQEEIPMAADCVEVIQEEKLPTEIGELKEELH